MQYLYILCIVFFLEKIFCWILFMEKITTLNVNSISYFSTVYHAKIQYLHQMDITKLKIRVMLMVSEVYFICFSFLKGAKTLKCVCVFFNGTKKHNKPKTYSVMVCKGFNRPLKGCWRCIHFISRLPNVLLHGHSVGSNGYCSNLTNTEERERVQINLYED